MILFQITFLIYKVTVHASCYGFGRLIYFLVGIKPHLMLSNPGNSSAFSRRHHSCVNLASHQLIMKV
jgi:hypothetical protein